jgi:hypothetical protein
MCLLSFAGHKYVLHLQKCMIRYTTFSTVTWIRDGRSGVLIPAKAIEFSLLVNVKTGSESHPHSVAVANPPQLLNCPKASAVELWTSLGTITCQTHGETGRSSTESFLLKFLY